jgi:hypothetical protein
MFMTTKQGPPAAPSGRDDAHYFVLEEFALTNAGQQRVERTFLLSNYEVMMSAGLRGAKRLVTCGAMSGDPSSFAQLWSVPKSYAPGDIDAKLPEVRKAALGAYLAGAPGHEVLVPTTYSPGAKERGTKEIAPLDQVTRWAPQDGGAQAAQAEGFNEPTTTPVVLIVHARVKASERAAFEQYKQQFFKGFVQTRGHWYLYAAGWQVKDTNMAVNCWALENAQDLLKVMMMLSENSIYQGKLRPTIQSESQSLYWLDWDAHDYFPYAHV